MIKNNNNLIAISQDNSKVEFKPKFIERYSKLTDWETFNKISLTFLRKSIRVNTLKIAVNALKKRLQDTWQLQQIPWCKEGFWIEHKRKERRDIGNLMEHALGYIYVQEAASMLPPIILDPKPNELILDMCASPGSKTTQIASMMQNKGLLVTNDIEIQRLKALGINLQRSGVINSIITLSAGRYFKDMKFNKILVDAPCSGTGTIRKSFKTLQMWNPDMIKRLAITQKQLIENAFKNLEDNGTLVYSTCSLEPEENEAVVDFLLNKYDNAGLEDIKLNIKRSPAILRFEDNSYNQEIMKCLRIWPQDNDTEGFFVARIRKD